MENASKALLISGGILLALIIITMLLYMANSVKRVRKAQYDVIATEQLQKFNQEYEAYNKKLLYGGEVLSLINKIKDNNEKNKNINDYKMQFLLEDFTEDAIEKTGIYTCTGIWYSTQTGRVSKMSFKKYAG